MGPPFLSPLAPLFGRDGHLGQLTVTSASAACGAAHLALLSHQQWRRLRIAPRRLSPDSTPDRCPLRCTRRPPPQASGESPGTWGVCPHRADFPAEATSDAVVLADVNLHSIPVRFNLPAPDPGN